MDIVENLRHTAGDLINGHMGDGEVSSGLLVLAADEIERLRTVVAELHRRVEIFRNYRLASESVEPNPSPADRTSEAS
jgi:hypothetical protein